MASPTDPRLLSTKDYLSVTFFRAIRCSLVLVPWSFGTIALNEGLYSIITVKPRTYRETIVTALRTGSVQTLRGFTWLTSTSLLSACVAEAMSVGPHFQLEPTEEQKTLYMCANASGGALGALVASVHKNPATSLGSRAGWLLSRPQLKFAYVVIGSVCGALLPGLYGAIASMQTYKPPPPEQ